MWHVGWDKRSAVPPGKAGTNETAERRCGRCRGGGGKPVIHEHDCVVLTQDIHDEGLRAGDVGTVVHIHGSDAAMSSGRRRPRSLRKWLAIEDTTSHTPWKAIPMNTGRNPKHPIIKAQPITVASPPAVPPNLPQSPPPLPPSPATLIEKLAGMLPQNPATKKIVIWLGAVAAGIVLLLIVSALVRRSPFQVDCETFRDTWQEGVEVRVKGKIAKLAVILIGPKDERGNGKVEATEIIKEEQMITNCATVKLRVDDPQSGSYTLLVKTFDPEKVVYTKTLELRPPIPGSGPDVPGRHGPHFPFQFPTPKIAPQGSRYEVGRDAAEKDAQGSPTAADKEAQGFPSGQPKTSRPPKARPPSAPARY